MANKNQPNEAKGKRYVWAVVVSIAGFIFAYYVANPLSDIYPIWGYIFFLTSGSIIIGSWVWIVVGWLWGKRRFVWLARTMTVLVVIISIWVTSPSYIDRFVRPQGTIEFPTWVDDSQEVLVHYGRRENDFFWTQKTIGE